MNAPIIHVESYLIALRGHLPGTGASAQDGCECHQAPIQIDGWIEDATWAKAPWTDLFVDIEGSVPAPAPIRTRAKMLWDQAVFLRSRRSTVWATLTEHDSASATTISKSSRSTRRQGAITSSSKSTLLILEFGTCSCPEPTAKAARLTSSGRFRGCVPPVHVQWRARRPGDRDVGWTVEIASWSAFASRAPVAPPNPGDGNWPVNFSRVDRVNVEKGAYVKLPAARRKTIGSGRHRASSTCTRRRHWASSAFRSDGWCRDRRDAYLAERHRAGGCAGDRRPIATRRLGPGRDRRTRATPPGVVGPGPVVPGTNRVRR